MQVDVSPRPIAPRRARRDPANRLLGALHELGGGHAVVLRHEERTWASITFSGARHTLTLRFVGDAAVEAGERFIAGLPDHEFTIPRRLVADAAIVAVRHALLSEPSLEVECVVMLLDEDCKGEAATINQRRSSRAKSRDPRSSEDENLHRWESRLRSAIVPRLRSGGAGDI